jgi:hypothetical protein
VFSSHRSGSARFRTALARAKDGIATGRITVISVDGGTGRLADIFGFGRAKDCGRITLQALRIVARFLKIAGAD